MKGVNQMKKSNLITGIIYIFIGAICLYFALTTETKLDGLLFGFAGAGIVPGIAFVMKYFYWNHPDHKQEFTEILENQHIEQHDELKNKLANQSARYIFIINIIIISASTVIFSILGSLEVLENTKVMVLYLAAFLIFQIVSFNIIYQHLLKKY